MAEFLASLGPDAAEEVQYLIGNVPFAIWETLYSTVLATIFAYIIGLPLGLLLAVTDADGNRYRITNVDTLDKASYKRLLMFI